MSARSDAPAYGSQPDEPTEGPLAYGASPEPSDDGASVDGQNPAEQKSLDTLSTEIAKGQWNFDGKDESEAKALRKRFWNENYSTVRSRDHMDSNIFHVLARLEDKKFRKLKPLVYSVVELCSELLKDKDKQGQTGLHSAIQHRNYRMVRQVLKAHDNYHRERDFDEILRLTSQNGNNLLHLAMKEMTPIGDTENERQAVHGLIEKASAETLCMQNQDGFTPIHLAVEGAKCTPQQLEIVQLMVRQHDKVLDIRTYKGKPVLSPYQYHQATFEEWYQRRAQTKPAEERMTIHPGKNLQSSPSDRPDVADPQVRPNPAKQHEEKPGDETSASQAQQKPATAARKPGGAPVGADMPPPPAPTRAAPGFSRPQRRSTAQMQLASITTSSHQQQQQPQTPASPSVASGQNFPRANQKTVRRAARETPAEKVTPVSAGAVARYLKHTYLRHRHRQEALEFLYGGVSEKQLDFNLFGKEGEIAEEDFTAGYKCANLEDSLQFVRIPHLVIKPTPPQPSGDQMDDQKNLDGIAPSKEAPTGRTDLGIIFRWLRNEAKVEKIIKLIVDDSHHPAHCDEEIERAVKPFKVEVWDWRKIDLCSETIAEAAPNARQVNLYWSGNNAVLRGWSDAEGGLARLKDLEKVIIFPQQGIEGPIRNRKNFEDFKARLQRVAKGKVQITMDDSEGQLHKVQLTKPRNDDAMQNHRWLKCMESFSRFIQNVRLVDPSGPSVRPITIAIIDDGIDTTERRLHDRIIGGQCFCADDESPSFCVSAGGHGTMMARLITRVFPQAQILSLKLDENLQANGSSQFSVRSAAAAIRYAVMRKVNIINMSWSIEKTEDNADQLEELEEAVNMAAQNKILMFCSASDQGKTEDKSYPGKAFSRQALCKIGAATATGGEYQYVSLNDVDFLFPGRVVEQEQDEDGSESNPGLLAPRDRSTEGSSIATAFASGLAGLLLHIMQITSVYYGTDDEVSDETITMAQYEGVSRDPSKFKEIFKKIGINDKKFVEVWKIFEGGEEKWKTGGRATDTKFKILANICSRLLV